MSFSAKGQGEPKLRRIKYRNVACACFTCLSSQLGCEGMAELDNMQTAFLDEAMTRRVLEFKHKTTLGTLEKKQGCTPER